jgi:hypothetical protein
VGLTLCARKLSSSEQAVLKASLSCAKLTCSDCDASSCSAAVCGTAMKRVRICTSDASRKRLGAISVA